MAAIRDASASADAVPLLPSPASRFRLSLRGAARFLRRVGGREVVVGPVLGRDSAEGESVNQRRRGWAYSRPVVLLDILWNLSFVAVAAGVMVWSRGERPARPLRVWIVGYVMQCVLHIVCVCLEYKRRMEEGRGRVEEVEGGGNNAGRRRDDEENSIGKQLETANAMFSLLWWIIGFYLVSDGSQNLTHDASHLYWLCIVFLAFDVFFVVFCVIVACIIGIAVCCCLPCIIAILYAVTNHKGAYDEDIYQLPRYKFQRMGDPEVGVLLECSNSGDPPMEHDIPPEKSECSICLIVYEHGEEVRKLPCNHHFHIACVDKWLRINAVCPLCKFNIINSNEV